MAAMGFWNIFMVLLYVGVLLASGGIAIYAIVLLFQILGQIARSLNEISVVLQEMLKDSRGGK
jgi:hypothetical protein